MPSFRCMRQRPPPDPEGCHDDHVQDRRRDQPGRAAPAPEAGARHRAAGRARPVRRRHGARARTPGVRSGSVGAAARAARRRRHGREVPAMTALPFRSLTETAAAIAAGEVSSREVTTACLARIDTVDPQLRAFVALAPERALAAADAADQARAAGKALGPLHGVPLAHKDMYYRTGEGSGRGPKIRPQWRPPRTPTRLRRLPPARPRPLAPPGLARRPL